jgi:hypothetical protein
MPNRPVDLSRAPSPPEAKDSCTFGSAILVLDLQGKIVL